MKPVELSEFDVNRIIYEETKSVVKDLLNERPFHDDPLAGLDPDSRRDVRKAMASQAKANRAAVEKATEKLMVWIISRLGNLLITPAYAPPDDETVERLEAERWRLLKQDFEYIAALVGMFPGIGDAVDLGMVVYYLSQKDFTGAAFSLLAAAPVVGAGVAGVRMAWKAKNYELVAKILKSQSQVRTGVKHPFINPLARRAGVDKYIKKVEDYLSRELDDVLSDPEQVKRMAKNLKLTHPRGARYKMSVREMEDQIIKRAAEISHGWKTGIMARLSVFVPALFVIAYAFLFLIELILDGRPIAGYLAYVDEAMDGLQGKTADMIWDGLTGAANEINAEARGETLEEAKEKFGSGMKATFSRPGEENFYRLVEDNLGKTKEEVEAAEMEDRDLIRALFQMYNRDPDDFKWPGGTE